MTSSVINCIIVDDEPQNQAVLSKMLTTFCPLVKTLATAVSVTEALEKIEEFKPQLVFLDIEMPGGDGFTLFEQIPDPDFLVIFTTAHADYAVKAIRFAALDYLLKPIHPDQLTRAVETAATKIHAQESNRTTNRRQIGILQENRTENQFNFQKIALPTSEGIDFFSLNDVLRCEADRAYCIFHMTGGKKVVVSNSLKEYEEMLASANFFRVHKSNMVNISHIQKYLKGKGGQVVLSDQSVVGVSTRKKEELMKVLLHRG